MAGYSATPLQKKLGIKEDASIFVSQAPEHYFDWISPLPKSVLVKRRLAENLDFIHLFVQNRKSFELEFIRCKKYLTKDGMLWISWPKKSSKVVTDLTRT